jgi:hypothetical protein
VFTVRWNCILPALLYNVTLLALIMDIKRVFCEVELILSALLYNMKLLVLIMEIQRVFCEVEVYFISTPLQYEIVGLDNGNSACLL